MVVGIDPKLSAIMGMLKSRESATSALVCFSRGLNGVLVLPSLQEAKDRKFPKKLLKLYEREACPHSRRVREALTILDLNCIYLPCPRGGERFSSQLKQVGGKMQVPYLVDENSGVSMYESKDIINYLFTNYGPQTSDPTAEIPKLMREGLWTKCSLALSTLGRKGRGEVKRATNTEMAPPEPPTNADEVEEKTWLELSGFESSPFTRLVRESFAELELPYVFRALGKGSQHRPAFQIKAGKMQIPYLEDYNPKAVALNGGKPIKMFESQEIINYLEKTYSKKE